MAGSYVRRPTRVLTTLTALVAAALIPGRMAAAAQPPASAPGAQTVEPNRVRLQLRVFEGGEDITADARLLLYPRGQRTGNIALALGPGPDQAFEADVDTGFYDVQVIRERRGQVLGIRWIENLLVQRYPDEYGRHLQVLNLNPEFGALQIRPAPAEVAATRGWSAVALAAGDTARELGKARPVGDDLLLVLPAGRYDIRVTLGDRSLSSFREIEIPADRTRLKTWAKTATP
jgi:hypothetical protein